MIMTNDVMLGGVYILMAVMLVLGSLMARREPAAKMIKMALAWIVVFAAGFVLFTFRDDFGYLAQRLKAEAIGTPVNQGRSPAPDLQECGPLVMAVRRLGDV